MEDQRSSDQGLLGKYLPNVLGLLGGAAGAKAALAAAAKPALGMMFTPPQFRRVMEQNPPQPMHPAVWRNLPDKQRAALGNPLSPRALDYQRKIDKEILYNPRNYESAKSENLFPLGWAKSPLLGLVREVPDSGSRLDITGNTAKLIHPSVDLQKLFGTELSINKDLPYGNASFYRDNKIELNPYAKPVEALHEYSHAGQHDAGKIWNPEEGETLGSHYLNPKTWSQRDLQAVADMNDATYSNDPNKVWYDLLKAHHENDIGRLKDFRDDLSYMRSAPEVDAYNVENRYLNNRYIKDPQSTQAFPNNEILFKRDQGPYYFNSQEYTFGLPRR